MEVQLLCVLLLLFLLVFLIIAILVVVKRCVVMVFICIFLMTVVHQASLSVDCPGKNTRVGCHFLLQGILVMSQAWIHHNLEDCSLTLVSP